MSDRRDLPNTEEGRAKALSELEAARRELENADESLRMASVEATRATNERDRARRKYAEKYARFQKLFAKPSDTWK